MNSKRSKRKRFRAAAKAHSVSLPRETVEEIERRIGYRFKDTQLLIRAMTHPGAVAPFEARKHSNQRLEFLGDRVLGLVVAERLLERYPTEREGRLAPRLNALVRKESCARAVRHLGIGKYLIMAEHDLAEGGRGRDSALGDLCEALIAAIYRDGGLKSARTFIDRAWASQFAEGPGAAKDAKSALQEWAQGRGMSLPAYQVTGRTGPDHAPAFEVTVTLDNGAVMAGQGASKQEAERVAAKKLLEQLTDD